MMIIKKEEKKEQILCNICEYMFIFTNEFYDTKKKCSHPASSISLRKFREVLKGKKCAGFKEMYL